MNILNPRASVGRAVAWRTVVAASALIALFASVTIVSAMSGYVSETTLPSSQASGTDLLSNLGQAAAPEGWERVGPEERTVYAQAQRFTTGSNEDGYSLSKIIAYLKDVSADDAPQVSIYTSDENGNPDNILHALSNPTSFSDGARNTFSAPRTRR